MTKLVLPSRLTLRSDAWADASDAPAVVCDMQSQCFCSVNITAPILTCLCLFLRVTAHNRFVLWKMGVTHVLNAAHGTAYSHGGQDFYGAAIDYYGVPAHDLPSFDISQFFFSAAQFIHNALNTPGGTKLLLVSFWCKSAASHNRLPPQSSAVDKSPHGVLAGAGHLLSGWQEKGVLCMWM